MIYICIHLVCQGLGNYLHTSVLHETNKVMEAVVYVTDKYSLNWDLTSALIEGDRYLW